MPRGLWYADSVYVKKRHRVDEQCGGPTMGDSQLLTLTGDSTHLWGLLLELFRTPGMVSRLNWGGALGGGFSFP